MDINSLKKDASIIEAGQWVGDIPNLGDVRLNVRGLSSPTVLEYRAELERKASLDDRQDSGALKTDAAVRILRLVLLDVVLLDWENLTQDGKPLAYSAENARPLLTDPDFADFADAVTWAASFTDRNAGRERAKAVKNSNSPSAGK